MNDTLLEQLLNEDERTALDCKRDQYPFDGASDYQKSELLKDILALTNAKRSTDAYILIGVEEIKGGRSRIVGIQHHLQDANLQQFVNSKTKRPIDFSYRGYSFEGHPIGIITIPVQERPVFLYKNDYGKLRRNIVYIRQNSSTREVEPDELVSMGAAAVKRNLEVDFNPSIQYKEKIGRLLPFTTKSLIRWGLVGLIPSLVGCIYTSFLTSPPFWTISFYLLFFLSLTSYITGLTLKKHSYIYIGKRTLKSNNSGNVFLAEAYGICPFCSGSVKLKVMPKGSDQRIMGICQTNSEQHTFSFDFTTFMGVYYPIVWRKLST